MLEKSIYYVSLKNNEVSKRSNLTESQYEIAATKSEIERLESYLKSCKAFEEEEVKSMINPFTHTEDKATHEKYKKDLKIITQMLSDLATDENESYEVG